MTPLHYARRQTFTPLLTPFRDGRIDVDCFAAAIDRQVIAGTDGIVVGDVIGEGPTLAPEERCMLLEAAIACGRPHLSVIAATGTNCTRTTIERSILAERMGADALLVTIPYYSKPTLAGVADHFRQIAEAVSIPLIVDDDPGRSARDFGPALPEQLARLPIIAGICHGRDRLAHFMSLSSTVKNRFVHLSKDDAALGAFLALGGSGAMSPIANVIPSPVQTLVAMAGIERSGPMAEAIAAATAAVDGDDVAALKEAHSFLHLSPADVRLPLVVAEAETVVRVRHALAAFARSEPGGRIAA